MSFADTIKRSAGTVAAKYAKTDISWTVLPVGVAILTAWTLRINDTVSENKIANTLQEFSHTSQTNPISVGGINVCLKSYETITSLDDPQLNAEIHRKGYAAQIEKDDSGKVINLTMYIPKDDGSFVRVASDLVEKNNPPLIIGDDNGKYKTLPLLEKFLKAMVNGEKLMASSGNVRQ